MLAHEMARIGREEGVRVVFEAFPDRAYTPEGRLVSRRLPGAVIEDPALNERGRLLEIAERVYRERMAPGSAF